MNDKVTVIINTIGFDKSILNYEIGSHLGETDMFPIHKCKENELIRRIIHNHAIMKSLLEKTKIEFPYFWVAIEIPRNILFRNWEIKFPHYKEAGDIDLIIGGIDKISKVPDFNNLIAYQIKIIKIDKKRKQKTNSGEGTKQSFVTTQMGFNKTLLIHFFLQEPSDKAPEQTHTHNMLSNYVSDKQFNIKENHVKSKLLLGGFGYKLLGLGQMTHSSFERLSIITEKENIEARHNPWIESEMVLSNRIELIESLRKLFDENEIKDLPFIVYDKPLDKKIRRIIPITQ